MFLIRYTHSKKISVPSCQKEQQEFRYPFNDGSFELYRINFAIYLCKFSSIVLDGSTSSPVLCTSCVQRFHFLAIPAWVFLFHKIFCDSLGPLTHFSFHTEPICSFSFLFPCLSRCPLLFPSFLSCVLFLKFTSRILASLFVWPAAIRRVSFSVLHGRQSAKEKKFALQRVLKGNKNSSFLAFVMLNDILFLDCLYNIVLFALSIRPTQIYLVCAMVLSFF